VLGGELLAELTESTSEVAAHSFGRYAESCYAWSTRCGNSAHATPGRGGEFAHAVTHM
jgi:hypothetical protein